MTRTRWTMPDIADHLGLAASTVHAYRARRQMPDPTGVIGRTPYWTEAAIRPWLDGQRANWRHPRADAPNGLD